MKCLEPDCNEPARFYCEAHSGKHTPRLCAGGCGRSVRQGALCWACFARVEGRVQAHKRQQQAGSEEAA